MNIFCLSTYINKYLKSKEETLEKIVMHKLNRFVDFSFLTQTQTPKRFGFSVCLSKNKSSALKTIPRYKAIHILRCVRLQ
jgi:hypothetical protein